MLKLAQDLGVFGKRAQEALSSENALQSSAAETMPGKSPPEVPSTGQSRRHSVMKIGTTRTQATHTPAEVPSTGNSRHLSLKIGTGRAPGRAGLMLPDEAVGDGAGRHSSLGGSLAVTPSGGSASKASSSASSVPREMQRRTSVSSASNRSDRSPSRLEPGPLRPTPLSVRELLHSPAPGEKLETDTLGVRQSMSDTSALGAWTTLAPGDKRRSTLNRPTNNQPGRRSTVMSGVMNLGSLPSTLHSMPSTISPSGSAFSSPRTTLGLPMGSALTTPRDTLKSLPMGSALTSPRDTIKSSGLLDSNRGSSIVSFSGIQTDGITRRALGSSRVGSGVGLGPSRVGSRRSSFLAPPGSRLGSTLINSGATNRAEPEVAEDPVSPGGTSVMTLNFSAELLAKLKKSSKKKKNQVADASPDVSTVPSKPASPAPAADSAAGDREEPSVEPDELANEEAECADEADQMDQPSREEEERPAEHPEDHEDQKAQHGSPQDVMRMSVWTRPRDMAKLRAVYQSTRQQLERARGDTKDGISDFKASFQKIVGAVQSSFNKVNTTKTLVEIWKETTKSDDVDIIQPEDGRLHTWYGKAILTVRIVAAHGLICLNSLPNPYVQLSLGCYKFRTQTLMHEANPVWDHADQHRQFSLMVRPEDDHLLQLWIYSEEVDGSDCRLGHVEVDLKRIPWDRWIQRQEKLQTDTQARAMDYEFLESLARRNESNGTDASRGTDSSTGSLTQDELNKICSICKCDGIMNIGQAAKKLAAELGGLDKVLEKLQKELGEATWNKVLKEYEKYKDHGELEFAVKMESGTSFVDAVKEKKPARAEKSSFLFPSRMSKLAHSAPRTSHHAAVTTKPHGPHFHCARRSHRPRHLGSAISKNNGIIGHLREKMGSLFQSGSGTGGRPSELHPLTKPSPSSGLATPEPGRQDKTSLMKEVDRILERLQELRSCFEERLDHLEQIDDAADDVTENANELFLQIKMPSIFERARRSFQAESDLPQDFSLEDVAEEDEEDLQEDSKNGTPRHREGAQSPDSIVSLNAEEAVALVGEDLQMLASQRDEEVINAQADMAEMRVVQAELRELLEEADATGEAIGEFDEFVSGDLVGDEEELEIMYGEGNDLLSGALKTVKAAQQDLHNSLEKRDSRLLMESSPRAYTTSSNTRFTVLFEHLVTDAAHQHRHKHSIHGHSHHKKQSVLHKGHRPPNRRTHGPHGHHGQRHSMHGQHQKMNMDHKMSLCHPSEMNEKRHRLQSIHLKHHDSSLLNSEDPSLIGLNCPAWELDETMKRVGWPRVLAPPLQKLSLLRRRTRASSNAEKLKRRLPCGPIASSESKQSLTDVVPESSSAPSTAGGTELARSPSSRVRLTEFLSAQSSSPSLLTWVASGSPGSMPNPGTVDMGTWGVDWSKAHPQRGISGWVYLKPVKVDDDSRIGTGDTSSTAAATSIWDISRPSSRQPSQETSGPYACLPPMSALTSPGPKHIHMKLAEELDEMERIESLMEQSAMQYLAAARSQRPGTGPSIKSTSLTEQPRRQLATR